MARFIVAAMAILLCLILTVENGAEQTDAPGTPVETPAAESADAASTSRPADRPPAPTSEVRITKVDSGWAVGTPGAIATGSADPQQQTILYHVLEQGRTPLIQAPVLAPPANSKPQSEGGVRFAVRPDGIEGWRSPGPIIAPLNESAETPAAVPQSKEPATTARQAPPPASAIEIEVAAPPEKTTPDADEKSFAELLGDANSNAPGERQPAPEADAPQENAAERTTLPDQQITPVPDQYSAPQPLTPQLVQLRSRVRSVLKGYYKKLLNSRDHDPWEVMHGMLAYGVHSRIRQGGPRGAPITSVGWMCYNKPCKGLSMLYVTPKRELRAKYGVGLQGHLGQFLAMLAQCRVAPDYPIRVGKNEFTIRDLIAAEKATCYPKSELTFKLIALQYYLDLDHRWVNDQGQEWDIPRLVREELAQPIRGAACGGTHRLSGLSLTVKTRVRRGEPLDGEYARAAEFVQKYHQYAFRLQNRDGSLSTQWFRGRGDDSDINRRIKTTGHILEWLCYSLSDEELRDERTIRAVSYLANLMYTKYSNEWEVGPMCHAIHALLVYDERVFGPFDAPDYNTAYRPRPETATLTFPSTIRR